MSNYIHETSDEPRGWRYGSELAIYTERFVDGRLLAASLVDTGVPRYAAHEERNVPAFDLVVDGESLAFGWEQTGYTAGKLTLRHPRKQIELEVLTTACGHGFFRRALRIKNLADKSVGLTSVTPWRGRLWDSCGKIDARLNYAPTFSLGAMQGRLWGNEGDFAWQDLPENVTVAHGSDQGKSGHSVPFTVLRNNLSGGYFVCHLAWSGNWRMSAKCNLAPNGGGSSLDFAAGPEATSPMRMIAPGESVETPAVHFGVSHQNFDAAIQNLHSHLRANALDGAAPQPVIYNHWGYVCHELSEARLIKEVDLAHEAGAELFMVDAGWYGNVGKNWWTTTGNWEAGDRLPNDLHPVFDHARSKGMQVGLWCEIESAGNESKLAQEHPDWFIRRYGKQVERILDLTKPAVAAYVESTIVQLIERYHLDMFRLDYNVNPMEGGFNLVDGREENTLWRHVETIYAIIERVRRKFPKLQWENCASGGGRCDLGMLSRVTTTWISDWQLLPRTVRIRNGMSMALPPEHLNHWFGAGQEACYLGDAEAQLQLGVLFHPTLSGLTPPESEANPALMALVKKYIAIHKDFVRPFQRGCKLYHHTLEIPGMDGEGWAALEEVSADRRRAVAVVYRLAGKLGDNYLFRFRGLDPALRYTLTTEPGTLVETASGAELMRHGVDIRLDSPLSSRLLLAQAES